MNVKLIDDFWAKPLETRSFKFCMEFLRGTAGAVRIIHPEEYVLWHMIAPPHLHDALKAQCRLEGITK